MEMPKTKLVDQSVVENDFLGWARLFAQDFWARFGSNCEFGFDELSKGMPDAAISNLKDEPK